MPSPSAMAHHEPLVPFPPGCDPNYHLDLFNQPKDDDSNHNAVAPVATTWDETSATMVGRPIVIHGKPIAVESIMNGKSIDRLNLEDRAVCKLLLRRLGITGSDAGYLLKSTTFARLLLITCEALYQFACGKLEKMAIMAAIRKMLAQSADPLIDHVDWAVCALQKQGDLERFASLSEEMDGAVATIRTYLASK